MGKKKLARFAEVAGFSNVVQAGANEAYNSKHRLYGRWAKDFFISPNPVILELGCGKGEYTTELARIFTDINFLGVDIKGARIWKGAKYALENKIHNSGFLRARIEMISSFFAKDEIDQIWITFPDPQLKKPGKRLTSPAFMNRYRTFLKKGGVIHLKTDSTELYDYTMSVIAFNGLRIINSTSDLYGSGLTDRILAIKTFYEQQFLSHGKPITYIRFTLDGTSEILEPDDDKGFFERVYEVTFLIPPGRVTTYGAIARYLGSAGSARMVGWALNNCHSSGRFIPAHRVVNRRGMLTGKHHFGTPNAMNQLLGNENVKVEDDRVVNFEHLFWDPGRHL